MAIHLKKPLNRVPAKTSTLMPRNSLSIRIRKIKVNQGKGLAVAWFVLFAYRNPFLVESRPTLAKKMHFFFTFSGME